MSPISVFDFKSEVEWKTVDCSSWDVLEVDTGVKCSLCNLMHLPLKSSSHQSTVVKSELPGMVIVLHLQAEAGLECFGIIVIGDLSSSSILIGLVVEVQSVDAVGWNHFCHV